MKTKCTLRLQSHGNIMYIKRTMYIHRLVGKMCNAVSSLIAWEDIVMCKGGNGLARSVLHVSHYEGDNGLAG